MKKLNPFLLSVFLGLLISSCQPSGELKTSIIPKPVQFNLNQGAYFLPEVSKITGNKEDLSTLAEYLEERIAILCKKEAKWDKEKGNIHLEIDPQLNETDHEEGYKLVVSKSGIEIYARKDAGLFNGIQSLTQLINKQGQIPHCEIVDYPRFQWRGFMLDVSRHFLPKDYILSVLDNMALHKLNTFHWHLVDDQGWRIEIKKYPKLTEIGAWRVDQEHLHWNARTNQKPGEKATYGGFYTQDEVKEIVAYAANRNITIVPEIEMPGHTNSVLAAYPEYACTDGPFIVLPGGVWPITDIYCAGKEETFSFLQDVLTEVLELFPSTYIHIGGDEANKQEWEKCDDCQRRIKAEGLADEHELQSYFITRIEKFLNAYGRQLIGWDEILEGGLAPNAAVMSWRGMQGGIEAAEAGHPVVMTPTSHCYFDYYQGKPELEPLAIGGFLPIEKVYEFEPIPEGLSAESAENIIGVQANLWTEYVPDGNHADYMTWPRLCALSEVAWTPKNQTDFVDFSSRLTPHLAYLDLAEISYAKSFTNVEVSTSFSLEKMEFQVELSNTLDFGEIRYTLDGSAPVASSMLYERAFTLDKTTEIAAGCFVDGDLYSSIASEKVWIHKATGKKVEYANEYSPKYTAGGNSALTNSLRGTVNLSDGRWQGFSGSDLSVLIDLEDEQLISSIQVGTLQTVGSWVFYPKEVTFKLLDEANNVVHEETITNELALNDPNRQIQDFKVSSKSKARYISITVKNQGTCPSWHAGAGQPSWLFVDEIIIL